MDVADLLRRLLRRRWASLAVVLVAVVAAAISFGSAGSSEQGGAAVVIVPPPLGDAVSEQNPLLNLDNNLSQLAIVLSASMQSESVTRSLRRQGATAPFTISTVTGTNPSFSQLSPQLVFTVTGATSAAVQRTSTALVGVARTQLRSLQEQADVAGSAQATLVQVVAPTGGEAVGGGRLRAAGSIGLAIVVLGLIGVLAFDEVMARRFQRSTGQRFRPPSRRRRRRFGAAPTPLEGDESRVLRSR